MCVNFPGKTEEIPPNVTREGNVFNICQILRENYSKIPNGFKKLRVPQTVFTIKGTTAI